MGGGREAPPRWAAEPAFPASSARLRESGVRVSSDPASQNSPLQCLPHRPPAAASGKAGLWPADPRRRGPFSFLGAGVLVGAGAGRGERRRFWRSPATTSPMPSRQCKPRGRVCRLRAQTDVSDAQNATEPRESHSPSPSSPVPRPP